MSAMSFDRRTTPRRDHAVTRACDRQLALRSGQGDGTAFAELYDRYEVKVFNYCDRILASQDDAADATQETFMRLLQRLPDLRVRHPTLGPYIVTTARNVCFDLIGRRKRTELVDDMPDSPSGLVGGRTPNHPAADPERACLIQEQRHRVAAANARLTPRQREVLSLRELEDMSYDEIAEIMGMNPNSVAQLLSRARNSLRSELNGTAIRSFGEPAPGCERALEIVNRLHDREAVDAVAAEWASGHLRSCAACRLAQEALQEVGLSYRGLVPLVPLEVLRRTTLARASSALAGHAAKRGAHATAVRRPARVLGSSARRPALFAVTTVLATLLGASSLDHPAVSVAQPVVVAAVAQPVPHVLAPAAHRHRAAGKHEGHVPHHRVVRQAPTPTPVRAPAPAAPAALLPRVTAATTRPPATLNRLRASRLVAVSDARVTSAYASERSEAGYDAAAVSSTAPKNGGGTPSASSPETAGGHGQAPVSKPRPADAGGTDPASAVDPTAARVNSDPSADDPLTLKNPAPVGP